MNASLSLGALASLSPRQRPQYHPDDTRVGIVHLGVGNFHRAHQAVYIDDALAAGERGWAICGINLRSRDIVDRLRAQDGLYTLLVREKATCARVIGALRETIACPVDRQRAAARLADPAVRIVTLTITEKGYAGSEDEPPSASPTFGRATAPGTGSAIGSGEGSAVGSAASPAIALLADGLARRVDAGAPGLTLLSCDNLSGNGDALHRVLWQEASRRGDAALLRFIEERIACPNTMVDRIVPATSAADRDQALALTGFRDACPVGTEPFTQWVIEDRFVAGRPDWARDGVQFVRDVAPFEAMKLRLLNAAHSALAYLGVPAGFTTVDEAIAEPRLRAFVERMWREDLVPTLPHAVRAASGGYREALLARFANPSLGHRLGQIAMDGSQKIPVRWLAAARARLAAGSVPDALALAVAAWLRYLGGQGEQGERWTIDDPLARPLAQRLATGASMAGDPGGAARSGEGIASSAQPPAGAMPLADPLVDRAAALLDFEPVFGDLGRHAALRQRVLYWYRRLVVQGTLESLR